MIYDCAVIGTGPAGVSSALNLKIHNKNFIWFGSKSLSEKVQKAEQILNYPGFYAASGDTLQAAFRDQIEKMGIEITESMINEIVKFGDHYALMAGADFYEAKTVILTTGVSVKTTLENEAEFLGRGVSYCATCDGSLYRGKKIAVLCNNARFEHEVRYLAEIAADVQYFPQYKELGAFPENVTIRRERVLGVQGAMKVNAIVTASGTTEVDGVFILRDSISLSSLLKGLASEDNHILVNRRMETNMPGVYAAGDCTGRPYQYTKAVGEGNVAAHSAIEYLDETGNAP